MMAIVCYAVCAVLFCGFAFLAKRFRDILPQMESLETELERTRKENLKLQSELKLTRAELEKTRKSLDSCTSAIESH
ncbi:MAG TPA: hypothetical protein PLQ01_05090 [Methanothrix sp.]|nr:hypothetical protein [Methanothrix sp.]